MLISRENLMRMRTVIKFDKIAFSRFDTTLWKFKRASNTPWTNTE